MGRVHYQNVRRFSSKPPVSAGDKDTVFQNDRFDNICILATTNIVKGFAPQSPENDENDENGGCPSSKGMVYQKSGPEKGVITKGVFSLEKSLESLKSLNSLKSLENGRNFLCLPLSGDSLEALGSLNSLESLENGLF